jgi:RimJ/RimL family protein N-acetyltransferase
MGILYAQVAIVPPRKTPMMIDELPPLETERLRLEPLHPRHAALLFPALQHPDLYTFMDEAAPTDVVTLAARYTRLATLRSPDGSEGWLNWTLRARDDGRYLGTVQATITADGVAEVAYVVFVAEWHQGYAREATAAMVQYLAGCDILRFTARIDPRNVRSAAVLVALGFELAAAAAPTAGDVLYHLQTGP